MPALRTIVLHQDHPPAAGPGAFGAPPGRLLSRIHPTGGAVDLRFTQPRVGLDTAFLSGLGAGGQRGGNSSALRRLVIETLVKPFAPEE